MISVFRKLWGNKRGNALAIAGASLPLIVGAAGLATDTIQWTLWKRQLQRAADSAAIAGVYDREAASGATTNTDNAVDHDLSVNLHTFYALTTGNANCSGKCTITYPADTTFQTDQVQVSIAIQQPLTFSSFFMSTAPVIRANATAAAISNGGSACIEALDKHAKNAIYFSGNTGVYMPDCDAFSNSADANSAAAKGSADVTANSIGGVGGIASSNNFHVKAYRPYSPALPDPFANVNPSASDMTCSSTTLDWNTNLGSLPTGTNCFSALSIQSNKSLNLTAYAATVGGVIYINGGDATFQGDFTCIGCTIVLTNKNASSPIGNIKTNAGANVNITAPTSDTNKFKGIAIYQDRRATDCNNCNSINGNSGSIIQGAIYFPSQEIQYNGTGTTSATCTMFVANRITFTGNSGVTNKFASLKDCAGAGLPNPSTVKIVRLVG